MRPTKVLVLLSVPDIVIAPSLVLDTVTLPLPTNCTESSVPDPDASKNKYGSASVPVSPPSESLVAFSK